ncbi:hypothetical protein [Lysobacter gummosus]|uniref:hypothetical protein n=1 Tax=Lysobacter gummosus TaxID=262324 RepID=UPI0036360903
MEGMDRVHGRTPRGCRKVPPLSVSRSFRVSARRHSSPVTSVTSGTKRSTGGQSEPASAGGYRRTRHVIDSHKSLK